MNVAVSTDAEAASQYVTVQCTSGSSFCNDDQPFVVTVTGSHDVFLRYEDLGRRGNADVARMRVISSSSSSLRSMTAQLIEIDGLPVLQLSTIEGKLDVVLLRKAQVQRVINQGSGLVSVADDVLVNSGPSLALASIGSGDVFVTSTATLRVEELTLTTQGSGRLQVAVSTFHVHALTVKIYASGDATVFATSASSTDSLSLAIQGSGSACLDSKSSLESDTLTIDAIGSGDASVGPWGSCDRATLSIAGSGVIDVGGMKCDNVNVDLLGSGDVIVQATDTLSGDVYGSGQLEYNGGAPHSITNENYKGLVAALPVAGSYRPAGCEKYPVPLLESTRTTDSVPLPAAKEANAADELRSGFWSDPGLANHTSFIRLPHKKPNHSSLLQCQSIMMKHVSLAVALATALFHSFLLNAGATFTISATDPTPTNTESSPYAVMEKTWTITSGDLDELRELKVQVAGNVFVTYDASLNEVAKVVAYSTSVDMLEVVDVTVSANTENGISVHYKNQDAWVRGRVVTRIFVGDPSKLLAISAAHAENIVLGESVVVVDDPTAGLQLATSGDCRIYVGSSRKDAFSLGILEIANSGDGGVQFQASAMQVGDVKVSLSGDSVVAILVSEQLVVDSIETTTSGDSQVFVQTADLQAQTLMTKVSGDGEITYSSSGTCVDQTIHVSGDGRVSVGSIACKNSYVTMSGDGEVLLQTTDSLTAVGHGSIKYVNDRPRSVLGVGKHSHITSVMSNKFKTYSPTSPPSQELIELTLELKATWFGDSPIVRVFSGMEQALNASVSLPEGTSTLGLVGAAALLTVIALKLRARQVRQRYQSIA
ncbi:hypothetical protein BBJ28_00008538 [Nothophytophthora sp. Chile5]|nr:hypothetical protein BBJ28_00008538 [Nothophytophthora sp. Chile5]